MSRPALDEAALAALPEHKRELARLLLAARNRAPDHPVPRGGTGPVPATPTQARLWRHTATQPAAGTGSHAVRLTGPLDAERLESALLTVARRHEALRTSLVEGPDGLMQTVAAEPRPRLRLIDLSHAGYSAQANEVSRHLVRSASQPLDLAAGEATAYRLLRLRPDEHVLVMAGHLAVFDGWSSAVFLADLTDAYRGRETGAPPVHFPDFAAWHRDWLAGPGGAAEIGYWRETLAGAPDAPAQADFRREHIPVSLRSEITAAGFRLGAAEGATPFMTLLAALAVVLAHRDDRRDIVVGTPVAGRVFAGLEQVIGQFTTVVPVRVDCSGRPTFATLLRRVRASVAGALAHQRLPVDTLFEGRTPPYSVLFALHNYPAVPLDLPEVHVAQTPGPPARHLELYSPVPAAAEACIGLVERDGRISGTAEYNGAATSAEQVRNLVEGIGRVLEAATTAPNDAVVG